MTATTPPPSGPISLADVRQALADTDPSGTNAGALRKIMGRGSYATIQKHLDAIRQERAPVVPVAPGTTPAPPADAVAAIWGAAYAAAQVLTLGRLEIVTAERDAARAQMRIPLKPATDSNPNPASHSSGNQAIVPVQTLPVTMIGLR